MFPVLSWCLRSFHFDNEHFIQRYYNQWSKHQVLILWFPCVPDVFKLQLGVNNKRYFVSADRTINCSCFMKLSTITELHKYPIQQRIQAITHYLLQQSENWWNEVSHGRAQPRLQPATEARRHNQQYSWTIIMAGRWQDHIVHHTHKLKMTGLKASLWWKLQCNGWPDHYFMSSNWGNFQMISMYFHSMFC